MTHGTAELRELVKRSTPVELPAPKVRRLIREAVGISQVKLGEVIGTSGVAVCRYESGQRAPRHDVRERYARALAELQHMVTEEATGGERDVERN